MTIGFKWVLIRLLLGFNPKQSMARPNNSFDSIALNIAVSPQVRMYLEEITLLGTYGNSPAETARMLLNKAVQDLIKERTIEPKSFAIRDGAVVDKNQQN